VIVRRCIDRLDGRMNTATIGFDTLRDHLDRDYALLLAAVSASHPAAPVPSCPDWTVTELAGHVAEVYRHKAECIRLNDFPRPWPPARPDTAPAEQLATAWALLTAQFDAHAPADPAATWHDPDQTVGFWIRRMAQETVIHRIDAELAAGRAITPIPDDLAADCVDEVLTLFLGFGSVDWREDFGSLLDAPDERPVHVVVTGSAGDRVWSVAATSAGVQVTSLGGTPDAGPKRCAVVTAAPDPMARWLWNRPTSGPAAGAVAIAGEGTLVAQMRALLVCATQ
jgi:uncharacterized protein (TIGR03083 family)